MTLLSIECALRFERVRELVYGDHGLPALCAPPAVRDKTTSNPALGWLADAAQFEIANRVTLSRALSSIGDERSVFIVGDSTCKFGFRETELESELADGTAVHKLCSLRQAFGGGELVTETVLQLPHQHERGVVLSIQTVLSGGSADTPRRFLNENEAPNIDLSLRAHLFGTKLLWGLRTLPWSLLVSHTAVGRYSGILPYRLLLALAGPLPDHVNYYMPDDPDLVALFAVADSLDARARGIHKRWLGGVPVSIGSTFATAREATYDALRATARAAAARNLDLVLLLLPSPMESEPMKRKMIELFSDSGAAWAADVELRKQLLWAQLEQTCVELRIRCIRADQLGLDDFVDNAHLLPTGRSKLLHLMVAAVLESRGDVQRQ